MRSYRESITSSVRRASGLVSVEIRRRNTLADFRAKNAENLKHVSAARDARDQGAEAIDAVAREMAAMHEALKPILRTKQP